MFESEDDTTQSAVNTPELPSWMIAGDNHNIGNSLGTSLLDPTTWGDRLNNAYKMAATGFLSGANSFYNTGVTVGRFVGATDAEDNDTGTWIAGIDDDLGQYYSKNRTAADLLGFIGGSLIPGLGGLKILNAGQKALTVAADTGFLGANIGRATGLLVPKTAMYIEAAAKDITQNMNIFSSLTANGVKALGSGVVQGTLEGIAFETAIQATMFKSPILEGQDTGDIIKNIAMGGLFGGVVGGAIGAVTTRYGIKQAVIAEQSKLQPLGSRALVAEGTPLANKIILNAEDIDNAATPIRGGGVDFNEGAATALYTDKLRRARNDIRSDINGLASGDNELGNVVADMQYGTTSQDTLNTFLHVTEISRARELTPTEKQIAALAKEGQVDPSLGVNYVKLHGEGAGSITTEAPTVLNLADLVVPSSGQSTKDAVLSEVRGYKFKIAESKDFTTINPATQSGHEEAQARFIWARDILKELPEDVTVHFTDLPILQRAFQDSRLDLKLTDATGTVIKDGFDSMTELRQYIIDTKDYVAQQLMKNKKANTEAVAKITDTKVSRIEGTLGPEDKDYFATLDAANSYSANLKAKGIIRSAEATADPLYIPQFAKLAYKIPEDFDGNVLNGLVYLKEQQKLIQSAADNVTAKWLGPYDADIPKLAQEDLMDVNTTGTGAGLFSFENSNYGTTGSKVAGMGSITKQIKTDFRQQTQDALEGALATMGRSQEASIEHAVINQQVTRSGELWVLDPESKNLIRRDAFDALQKDPSFELGPKDVIEIRTPQTYDVISAEIERTSMRTEAHTEINAIYGRQTNQDASVYRPIRPNLNDFQHFAFVKDDKVTGSGHTTMLHATTPEKLNQLITAVKTQSPEFRVITKTEIEDFKKASGDYEYAQGLNENYLNSELKNKGIFSEFYTKTDPQKIVNDILQQHLRADDVLATELVRLKNQPAFDWLADMGSQFTKVEASKFGSSLTKIEKEGKNPYTDYTKLALDISKASEYPLLYNINKTLDSAVSSVVDKFRDVTSRARSPEDMNTINVMLDQYGMNTGYRSAATDLLVNHTAPKGELSKFIRGANSILARLTLGLDPLNAINNGIGANILRGTELSQVTAAIAKGDSSLVGKLAELTQLAIPATTSQITSPTRLVAGAISNFFKDDGTLLTQYQKAGYIKDIPAQFRSMLDDFTLQGTESVSDLNSRLQSAFKKMQTLTEKGEKLTGNKWVEQFNRFISADVMRQITDVAVQGGKMDAEEAHSYINTFVNRVEGNTIASQRPIIFQGPVGQAIGLFQSYQFNLMQQMFRYVGEGSKKDAAMLLGLQGTFYGLQGLPAFQFMNQHLVGTLSGNKNHTDLYDATLGIGGKQIGEMLLYGLPSNILQTNLYSRGDINPRQISVIPTSPAEVPFFSAFGKLVTSIQGTMQKVANGAPVWESMLQGLEHNGLSRPMAGLAQSLQAFGSGGQAYSTTSKGSILTSNDLLSWATATRLAGGRPLDEAVMNDAIFRIHSYSAYDKNKMDALSEATKASLIKGNVPSEQDYTKFAQEYAARGGNNINFNKYMMDQYKKANTSEAAKIQTQLTHPLAQKAQLLMTD